MLVSAVSAGVVPEYSVVRYYVGGKSPHVGYVTHGPFSVTLIDPLGGSPVSIGVHALVELLATPAATACFYIGRECR